ncbi:ankyrin repeat domain-containing protein [Wolbachia pipientis]|uniref:ankyrin repeat domain-containing protein n=1 Tax=Wolbachia pipientis TaxID=955 RepID=UPI001ABE5204|nr:ankyrin repeat domain-containing protein [Wolbachia pipientis]QTG98974.1 ankyrin repeat domain-containing protein [Wolbachia pipientis]
MRGRKYTPLDLLIENNREEGVKNILDNLRRERYPSKLPKVINTLDEYGYSPLRFAVENSNLQIVKYLVESGADLDIKYEKGFTPLHFAAVFGDLELARYLIDEEGVSFNVLDKYGRSPLHIASENGRIELVKYLVGEKKANLNLQDKNGMTPLHFVAENGHLGIVKFLIDKGADFFLRDRLFKSTPIEWAIHKRLDDIVKYLTEVKDRFGFTYLHKAAWDGNLDLFKYLINHNADLYRVGKDGSSPLHRAAENGKLEIVRYIIDKKLYNIDVVDNIKQTPLHLAAQNGYLEIVKILKEKGADINAVDYNKDTPLHLAAKGGFLNVVMYLIRNNANYHIKLDHGWTLLHLFARIGSVDGVGFLMEGDENLNRYFIDQINARDNNQGTALGIAAQNGYLEIVKILKEKGADINAVDYNKDTPLHLAARGGFFDVVMYLIEKQASINAVDRNKDTPLHLAAKGGFLNVVMYLIRNNANYHIKLDHGWTLLHLFARIGSVDGVGFLMEGDENLNRYFIDQINARDNNQGTALGIAAQNGYLEIVKILKEKGADINAVDYNKDTPLHLAARGGFFDVVMYLIEKQASINAVDRNKDTPLHLAAKGGFLNVVMYLIRNNANYHIKLDHGWTLLHLFARIGSVDGVGFLMEGDENLNRYFIDQINARDNNQGTALGIAAQNGYLEIVKILKEKGADINAVDYNKDTPLHLAAQNGYLEIVKILKEKGADINAVDYNKDTPLHLAAQNGYLEIVKILKEKGADINAVDYNKDTPLHLAAQNGYLEIVKILKEKGADINAVDYNKDTPLHLAARGGFFDVVMYLIEKQASCDIKNYLNLTPLALAKELLNRNPQIYQKIIDVLESKSIGQQRKTDPIHQGGEVSAEECLPSTSSGIRRNKRNAENECLFAWEDVDEFNVEKDEQRDFSKINIDSQKFINYIKDLSEEKRSQLIQLANEVQVTGNAQGLVSKLISNQKIMSHLAVVGRISGIAMHGMMAKNVLADFLNGDYKGVAINIGFIASDQGFAKVAESASLKGLKLASEGKLLLGRSLKAASPFLARGTSAFVIYDLVNQIKAFKNGTEEALVGVVGDSIYLGVDAAEIGIEIAEAFEVLEGVSSVTGPIGAAVGAVVFIGTDIYMAVKRVDKIDEIVHLTGGEKIIEGLRAFVGMKPEQYIGELMGEKQVNDQLVKQGLEYLKQHNDTQRYVFPTGKSIIDSCYTFTIRKEACRTTMGWYPDKSKIESNTTQYCRVGGQGIFQTLEREKCKVKIQDDLDNVVFFDKEVSNVIYDRANPDAPDGGELFCLPTGPIRPESGGENAYLCHDAIGLDYPANRTGNYALIALGRGKDQATGFRDSPNIFLVDDGDKEFTGGDKDDVFILVGNKTIGTLDGGNGNNTLNLAGFALDRDYIDVKFKLSSHYGSIFSPSDIVIKNIHKIYGRKGKQDIIDYGCDIRYVDGQGGKSNDSPDHIIIPYCNSVNRKQIIVRPSTTIDNSDESRHGIFDYIILPDEGKANINIEYDYAFTQQRKHNFLFNYTLFDLASVNIENVKDINYWYPGYGKMTHTIRNVTFSFLSPSLKGKSINEKFDIIISDIPANASYIVGNNAEIKIGNKGNLYMLENTNQPVDEVINSYLTMANRLKKISFFIQSRNETVVIGSGNHEVIYNNPLHRSNLVGNGGENVYVIDSESEGFEINKLPLPEVVVYDLDAESSVDTIDLRNLVQQARSKFSNKDSFELKVLKSESDLLLKATVIEAERTEDSSVSKIRKHEYFTVRLKDGVNWYNKTHVIVDNFPVKISLDNNEWSLRPQPLVFEKDKGVIIVTGRDVEENTELIIPRKGGNYTFVREHGTDLMITNVFDANITQEDFCTITLSGFYEELKMETLSIKFADKEIVLKDHREEISTARDMNIVKKEHSEQVYNDVFNHAKSESEVVLVDQVAHKHRYEQSRHRIRNRRSENIISSGARPPSWINDLFGWVKSSVGGLVSSVANKFAAKESEDHKLGDTGAYSSGLEKMYSATIPQSRKSLVVTKGNIPNRSWSSNREKVRSNVTVAPEISTAVVNSALILGDLAVRFMNGTRYEQPIYENLLSPREQSMRSIDEDMIIRAIQQGKEKFGVPGTNMDEVKIIGNKTEIGK